MPVVFIPLCSIFSSAREMAQHFDTQSTPIMIGDKESHTHTHTLSLSLSLFLSDYSKKWGHMSSS